MTMTDQQIDDLTTKAVQAALEVIDSAIPGVKRSDGPLGDELAWALHRLIENQIGKAAEATEPRMSQPAA